MKRYIRSAIDQTKELDELVDLLAKTEDGQWVKIFTNIPRRQAHAIWDAGFATGDNRFSVEDETSRRVREWNNRTLHGGK